MLSEINEFFLVLPPGLEKLAEGELKQKALALAIELAPLKVEKGGITLELANNDAFRLIRYLKIPTTALLRMAKFNCRDFPKLFKKISKLPWQDFLLGQTPIIKVSSTTSRLLHTGRIKEVVQEAIEKFYKARPPKAAHLKLVDQLPPCVIHLRLLDDMATVSIDLCGNALFRRGRKSMSSKAPLRENLASGIFFQLSQFLEGKIGLIDPMCGSATLLIEARDFDLPNTWRPFSFEYFPLFSRHSPPPLPPLLIERNYEFIHLQGIDRDEAIVEQFPRFQQGPITISLKSGDFFSKDWDCPQSNVVFSNPPYNERLTLDESEKNYFQKYLQHLHQMKNIHLYAIIVPLKISSIVKKSSFKIISSTTFSNGGIPVTFFVLKK